jgi:hypothetical protein
MRIRTFDGKDPQDSYIEHTVIDEDSDIDGKGPLLVGGSIHSRIRTLMGWIHFGIQTLMYSANSF